MPRHRPGGIAPGVAAVALIAGNCWVIFWIIRHRRRRQDGKDENRCLSVEAREIERHILKTQTPARLLGIRVDELGILITDDGEERETLTLSAPLKLNTNVHGSAFAGSLYSVAVLCSYYLARQHLVRTLGGVDAVANNYILVAKAGSIRYRRPVRESRIVARSILPSAAKLDQFRKELMTLRQKAVLEVSGQILLDHRHLVSDGGDNDKESVVVACEYVMEVCAYEQSRTLKE